VKSGEITVAGGACFGQPLAELMRFFERPDWKNELMQTVNGHRARFGDRGVRESDHERRERILSEMRESRRTLERYSRRANAEQLAEVFEEALK